MLDSDSASTNSIDYDEVYSLFTKNDLEDVLMKTTKIPMTVKEECEAIEKLKSENFDLKWRLYLLNQDYKELLNTNNANGYSKQTSENGSVKNLSKKETSTKDKEIKMLRTVLEQRVRQLSSLKNYYDEIIKSKDAELDDLKMEKTSSYVTELECNAAALYEILEQKDREILEFKEQFENQKNEIEKLKDELKLNLNNLINQPIIDKNITNQSTLNKEKNDMTKLSLEQTRKELDQLKFELKNIKIIEKEKLENYSRLVTEKEVEIELLQEQINSLKETENFLRKENETLQRANQKLQRQNEEFQSGEDKLVKEIKRLKFREDHLFKENQEYEMKIKEDYLLKKKHLLKEKNQQTDSPRSKIDENSNLIRNSIDVQELFEYTKSLEERLDYQNRIMQKNELEKEQLILTLNSLKEKKKNLESIISKQLAKTNHLLATAKQNLIDK